MRTVEKLKKYLSESEIIEVAEFAINGRKLEAAKRLQYLLIDKWTMPIGDALCICCALADEFSSK